MTDSTNLSAENAADTTSMDSGTDTGPDTGPADGLNGAVAQGQAAAQVQLAEVQLAQVQLAQAVVDVPLPQPGETVVIQAAAGSTLHFLFDPAAATSTQEDGDLVLQINGGEVVIEGWETASSGATPVEITNADGTVINMADFLVALGISPEGETLPAAGGEPGGPLAGTTPNEGAGFTPGPAPTILGGLGPDGPVDPTALQYTVPEREPFIFDLEEEDDGGPNAENDGPGTDNDAACVEEDALLIDGGEGGYGYGGLQEPTDGAAMKTSVTVNAGDTLTFKFNFLDGEAPGQTNFFDFAVVVIGDQVFKLADVTDATTPLGVSGFSEQTGYLTFTFTFTTGGTFDIGFAVLNEGDTLEEPSLIVDDVTITGGAFSDGFEAGLGGWTTLGDVTTDNQVAGINAPEGTLQAELDANGATADQIETFFNLPAGTLQTVLNADLLPSVSDNVLDNDDLGADLPTTITGISYAGGESATPLTVTDDGGSPIITFTANDGSEDIWSLVFNLDTGDYTFTLLAPYDHSAPGEDQAHENFTYTIEDANGDSDSANLQICIKDDVPTVDIEGSEGGLVLDETVGYGYGGDGNADDETDPDAHPDAIGFDQVSFFSLYAGNIDAGADGEASVELSLAIASPGVPSGLTDTATDESVLLFLEGGVVVGRAGGAGGEIVLTIEIDSVSEDITVNQFRAVVHDDPSDPDEAGSPETIAAGVVSAVITVTDGDGDTATDSADLGQLIKFEDDGPDADISGAEGAAIRLDETDNDPDDGDVGGLLANVTVAGAALFTDVSEFGSDGPGTKSYALDLAVSGTDSGVFDTATGLEVVLSDNGGVIEGHAGVGGPLVFTIGADPATGSVTVQQHRAVRHDDPADPDEASSPVSIDWGAVSLEQTVTDGDGDSDTDSIEIGSKILFEDDGPSVVAGTAAPDTLVVDETNLAVNASASFAALFAADFGSDGPGSVGGYALGINAGATGIFDTATGLEVVLVDNAGVIEGHAGPGGPLVFTVSVDAAGVVTLDQLRAVMHDVDGGPGPAHDDPKGLAAANLITLTATATDGDGDTATATANIGGALTFRDDGPHIELGAEGTIVVDESLGFDPFDPNSNDENSSLDPDDIGFAIVSAFDLAALVGIGGGFGADGVGIGIGSVALSIPSDGFPAGLVDTASGLAVVLVDNGGVIEGHAGAPGGPLVFTVELAGDDVEVHQYRAIVHNDAPDDHDEDDDPESIAAGALNLTFTFTDGDGDTASDSIDLGQLIKFEDDGPSLSAVAAGPDTLVVDETNLAVNASASFAALFTGSFGSDGPGTVGGYTLGINAGATGLVDTATGEAVTLQVGPGGVVQGVISGGIVVFTVSVDAAGVVTLDQLRAVAHDVDGGPGPDHDDPKGLAAANLITLTATATDGDGDTATATANIGNALTFKDDGPTLTAAAATALVADETDLTVDVTADFSTLFTPDFGADGAGTVGNYTLGINPAPTGLIDTETGQAVTLQLVGGVVQGVIGGGIVVFTVSVDAATGVVTLDQQRAVAHDTDGGSAADHDDQENLAADDLITLTATVTDKDGDTNTATVNLGGVIAFKDDGPTGSDDEADTTGSFDSINLTIIFDRSGSMDEDPGNDPDPNGLVNGFSTRLDLARAAVASLMAAYDSFADVNIKIVDFAGNANHSQWFTGPDALVEANAYLAGLTAAGETDYEAGITETINNYDTVGDPAPAADKSVVYFLSDGNPTEGTVNVAAWEAFLTDPDNNIETAFAVGIGADVTNVAALEDIAFPNNPGDPLDDGNPVLLTDESQIFDTLLLTVTGIASGNVLTDAPADDFGADGEGSPKIIGFDVDGVEYEFDGVDITRKDGNAFPAGLGTSFLVIVTALGGTITFDFLTGDYDYAAAEGASGIETFTYTILDGDGDTADATLTIDVVGTDVLKPNLVTGTDAPDTLIGDADTLAEIISGGDGDDHMTANGSDDLLIGGAGADALFGGAGRDVLIGGTQGETQEGPVRAADGADYLDGGDGADFLFGNQGDDILIVGTGDVADGDQGSDFFVLTDNVGFGSVNGVNPTSPGDFSIAAQPGNVLAFDETLDLTSLADGKLAGIETITMADAEGTTNHPTAGSINHFDNVGADTLMLSALDVISMGNGTFNPTGSFDAGGGADFGDLSGQAAIRVDGDAGDILELEGPGTWHLVDAGHGQPAGYDLYVHDAAGGGTAEDAYVLVQQEITVNAS